MNETLATATTTPANTTTDRIGPQRTEVRQRPQQPRTQPAATLTNIRRPRYQDIHNFLSRATAAVTTTHATQPATEETIAPTDNLISRCRANRNRLQPPRSQATQDTAEEETTTTGNTLSAFASSATDFSTHKITGDASTHGRTDQFHHKYLLSFTFTAQPFSASTTQPSTSSTDTWRFFPGRISPKQRIQLFTPRLCGIVLPDGLCRAVRTQQ
jgi:hypothetical protein